ncbi:hypothetical protein GCM10027402_07210 [Arthrobacter monumenti]
MWLQMSFGETPRSSPIQDLNSAEEELLLLLYMCPETAEELECMLAEEDHRQLNGACGTAKDGVAAALKRLAESGLVTVDSEPASPASSDVCLQEVWRLTELGRAVASQEAMLLNEWDRCFQAELVKLGITADAAARAVGAVSDTGDNYGDPADAALRYAATNRREE